MRKATESEQVVAPVSERLIVLEAIIERGRTTFVEVAEALQEIRDDRLYRPQFASFELYCQQKWGWTRRHVDRQIEAARIVADLRPRGLVPATEKQTRALVSLRDKPGAAGEVWAAAIEHVAGDSEHVTARMLREAVRGVQRYLNEVRSLGEAVQAKDVRAAAKRALEKIPDSPPPSPGRRHRIVSADEPWALFSADVRHLAGMAGVDPEWLAKQANPRQLDQDLQYCRSAVDLIERFIAAASRIVSDTVGN